MVYRLAATIRRFRLTFAVLLMMGLFPLVSGCSTYDNISRKTKRFTKKTARSMKKIGKLKFTNKGMKRKVIIGPMADKTAFQLKDFGEAFHKDLVSYLKEKCSGPLFYEPGDAAYPEILKTFPKEASGETDNFKLGGIGRQVGLNAIATGTVIDIRQYAEERGIIFWRDTHNFIQVLVNVEVLDTATGAKLADESYMYETELDVTEFEDFGRDKQELIPIIDSAIADAADFLGYEFCEAVRNQPWTGYVVSVDGNRVEISSGSEVGLTQGRVLEVFKRGEIVNAAFGERFFMPGEKIGEIEITQVGATSATAINTTDQQIAPDDRVRPK